MRGGLGEGGLGSMILGLWTYGLGVVVGSIVSHLGSILCLIHGGRRGHGSSSCVHRGRGRRADAFRMDIRSFRGGVSTDVSIVVIPWTDSDLVWIPIRVAFSLVVGMFDQDSPGLSPWSPVFLVLAI